MKSIQEIAKQAAVDYLKFKLGDRKGFNVYDIDALDADELIAEIEQECTKSFLSFLAAVDAERGERKDAVGYDEIFNAIAEASSPCGEGIGVSVKAFKRAIGGEIFLSATSQWISVENSLPKEETPVLIIYNGNVVIGERRWEHPTFEDSFKSHWYWDDPTDDGQDWGRDEVTHWMPLPPPPAGVTK